MHNHVILTGRFTAAPELTQTPSGVSVCRFSLAVQRKFNKNKSERETDFIEVEAWRGTAEFISKFFGKGDMIDISGSLRTSRWKDSEDKTHYKTYVAVNDVDFAPINNSRKAGSDKSEGEAVNTDMPDMADFEEVIGDSEYPF